MLRLLLIRLMLVNSLFSDGFLAAPDVFSSATAYCLLVNRVRPCIGLVQSDLCGLYLIGVVGFLFRSAEDALKKAVSARVRIYAIVAEHASTQRDTIVKNRYSIVLQDFTKPLILHRAD